MKTAKKDFIERVRRDGIVDTRKYRYIAREVNGPSEQHLEIRRIPLDCLDTTAALDRSNWETVHIVR